MYILIMTSKKLNIYNIKAGCRYVYPKLTIYNISEKSIYRGELPERAEAHHSWTPCGHPQTTSNLTE